MTTTDANIISQFTNTLKTNPDMTSTSSLANLKLLLEMSKATEDMKDGDLPVKQWFNDEVKSLKIAVDLLKRPQVQARFGRGFQAAADLAALVKHRVAEKEFERIMDSGIQEKYLDFDTDGTLKPTEADSRTI